MEIPGKPKLRDIFQNYWPGFFKNVNVCTPMFIVALFTIAKTWKQPTCPSIDEWIRRCGVYVCVCVCVCVCVYIYIYIYIHKIKYYSSITKNEIMPFAATWIDLEIIILSEVKSERQIPHDITYIWNLKYDTNELIYKTETDPQT